MRRQKAEQVQQFLATMDYRIMSVLDEGGIALQDEFNMDVLQDYILIPKESEEAIRIAF